MDMMDNASALPTCPQRQHQQQTADRNWPENRPHDFTMKLQIRGLRGIEWAIFDAEGLTKPRIT
jgi:hypothetical protein